MTPKARQRHLVALKKVLTDAGFRQDNYGNFKYPEVNSFRFKFKSNNLRIERALAGQWRALESKVWSQLTLDYFTKAVESMKKRVLREILPKETEEVIDIKQESTVRRISKNSDGVPLAPSLSDPVKAAQINTVLEKRNHQDYQCYMILMEMRDAGLLFSGRDVPADMMDAADLGHRARTAISNRIDLNDKFMRLMAGVE